MVWLSFFVVKFAGKYFTSRSNIEKDVRLAQNIFHLAAFERIFFQKCNTSMFSTSNFTPSPKI